MESQAAKGKIDPAVVAEYEKATTPQDYATMPDRVTPKGPGGSHHGVLATHHAKLGQHYKAKGQSGLAEAHKALAIEHSKVAESEPADEAPVAKRAKASMAKRAPKVSL